MRWLILAVAIAFAAVSCGDDGESVGEDSSDTTATTAPTTTTPEAPEPTTTEAPTTTSAPEPTIPTTTIPPEAVVVERDVRYGADRNGFHPALLDVYRPPGDGPWPMVMLFPGGGGQGLPGLSTSGGIDERQARLIASQGAVVFNPSIAGMSPNPFAWELRFIEDPGVSCATSFALANAATYSGDPDELTLSGVSSGAIYSAMVAMAEDPPGAEYCLVPPEPVEPDTLVLWEGDWLLGFPVWDDALEANPTFFQDEWVFNQFDVDADLKSTWHVLSGSPERVSGPRLPVEDPFGTGDECGRPIEPGENGIQPLGGMCRWFELRDPTGDLRREMGELGFYDDGWLPVSEESVLFAAHLEAAGIDPHLQIFDDAEHIIESSSGDAEAEFIRLIVNG